MNTFSKHLPAATTTLLGGILVVFGLNGFLNFIPMSPPEGDAGVFMGGLAASGYFFPLLKLTEIVVGLALVFRRYVPLALIVLAPITINIFAFHLFLEPATLPMAVFFVVANAGLAIHHRESYRALFVASTATRSQTVASAVA
jgi:putative oxidoreductase